MSKIATREIPNLVKASLEEVMLEHSVSEGIDNAMFDLFTSRLTHDEQIYLYQQLFKLIKAYDADVSGQLLIEQFEVQFWPARWGDR